MGIVTTYVCDVSGFTDPDKSKFVSVRLQPQGFESDGSNSYEGLGQVDKLISRDVALRLGLIKPNTAKGEVAQPELTFESKLSTLLKDYIDDLVYDAVQDQRE